MSADDEDGTREPTVVVSESDLAYRSRFVGRPSRAIIDSLMTLTGGDSADIPVAYTVLDLDALDNLFRTPDRMQFPGELSFCLGEYRFFLSSDGLIEVYELDVATEVDETS